MADTVDQILKSLDIDSIDPTLILSSIISQNENLSSTIIKSMEKSVLSSTQSISKGYKDIEKGLSDLGKQISEKSKNFSIRDILTDNENLKKASDSKYLKVVNDVLDSVKSTSTPTPLPNRMDSNVPETKTPPKIPGVPPASQDPEGSLSAPSPPAVIPLPPNRIGSLSCYEPCEFRSNYRAKSNCAPDKPNCAPDKHRRIVTC